MIELASTSQAIIIRDLSYQGVMSDLGPSFGHLFKLDPNCWDPKCLHSAAIKRHVAKIKIINRKSHFLICLVCYCAITLFLFIFIFTFYNFLQPVLSGIL